jgi:hypothetical protein
MDPYVYRSIDITNCFNREGICKNIIILMKPFLRTILFLIPPCLNHRFTIIDILLHFCDGYCKWNFYNKRNCSGRRIQNGRFIDYCLLDNLSNFSDFTSINRFRRQLFWHRSVKTRFVCDVRI